MKKIINILGYLLALVIFITPKIIPTIITIFLYIFSGLKEVEVVFSDGIVLKIPDIGSIFK